MPLAGEDSLQYAGRGRTTLTAFLLSVCLAALAYCGYRIQRLKSDIAVAIGTGTIFLNYITEQRGAPIYLVVDALQNAAEPPTGASDLEIKVARIIMRPPKNRQEMDIIWNSHRRDR
jgi:hypothetical protein